MFDEIVLGAGAFATVFKGHLKGENPLLRNVNSLNYALEIAENASNEVAVKMLHTYSTESDKCEEAMAKKKTVLHLEQRCSERSSL